MFGVIVILANARITRDFVKTLISVKVVVVFRVGSPCLGNRPDFFCNLKEVSYSAHSKPSSRILSSILSLYSGNGSSPITFSTISLTARNTRDAG